MDDQSKIPFQNLDFLATDNATPNNKRFHSYSFQSENENPAAFKLNNDYYDNSFLRDCLNNNEDQISFGHLNFDDLPLKEEKPFNSFLPQEIIGVYQNQNDDFFERSQHYMTEDAPNQQENLSSPETHRDGRDEQANFQKDDDFDKFLFEKKTDSFKENTKSYKGPKNDETSFPQSNFMAGKSYMPTFDYPPPPFNYNISYQSPAFNITNQTNNNIFNMQYYYNGNYIPPNLGPLAKEDNTEQEKSEKSTQCQKIYKKESAKSQKSTKNSDAKQKKSNKISKNNTIKKKPHQLSPMSSKNKLKESISSINSMAHIQPTPFTLPSIPKESYPPKNVTPPPNPSMLMYNNNTNSNMQQKIPNPMNFLNSNNNPHHHSEEDYMMMKMPINPQNLNPYQNFNSQQSHRNPHTTNPMDHPNFNFSGAANRNIPQIPPNYPNKMSNLPANFNQTMPANYNQKPPPNFPMNMPHSMMPPQGFNPQANANNIPLYENYPNKNFNSKNITNSINNSGGPTLKLNQSGIGYNFNQMPNNCRMPLESPSNQQKIMSLQQQNAMSLKKQQMQEMMSQGPQNFFPMQNKMNTYSDTANMFLGHMMQNEKIKTEENYGNSHNTGSFVEQKQNSNNMGGSHQNLGILPYMKKMMYGPMPMNNNEKQFIKLEQSGNLPNDFFKKVWKNPNINMNSQMRSKFLENKNYMTNNEENSDYYKSYPQSSNNNLYSNYNESNPMINYRKIESHNVSNNFNINNSFHMNNYGSMPIQYQKSGSFNNNFPGGSNNNTTNNNNPNYNPYYCMNNNSPLNMNPPTYSELEQNMMKKTHMQSMQNFPLMIKNEPSSQLDNKNFNKMAKTNTNEKTPNYFQNLSLLPMLSSKEHKQNEERMNPFANNSSINPNFIQCASEEKNNSKKSQHTKVEKQAKKNKKTGFPEIPEEYKEQLKNIYASQMPSQIETLQKIPPIEILKSRMKLYAQNQPPNLKYEPNNKEEKEFRTIPQSVPTYEKSFVQSKNTDSDSVPEFSIDNNRQLVKLLKKIKEKNQMKPFLQTKISQKINKIKENKKSKSRKKRDLKGIVVQNNLVNEINFSIENKETIVAEPVPKIELQPMKSELKIGNLTLEERKLKIEKYLKKKRERKWNRKINYYCRKQVADQRLRVKGRFMKKSKEDKESIQSPID